MEHQDVLSNLPYKASFMSCIYTRRLAKATIIQVKITEQATEKLFQTPKENWEVAYTFSCKSAS